VGITEGAISWLYSDSVVYRVVEPLLAAEVPFGRFHRNMAQKPFSPPAAAFFCRRRGDLNWRAAKLRLALPVSPMAAAEGAARIGIMPNATRSENAHLRNPAPLPLGTSRQ
jgi:hypothetical protein